MEEIVERYIRKALQEKIENDGTPAANFFSEKIIAASIKNGAEGCTREVLKNAIKLAAKDREELVEALREVNGIAAHIRNIICDNPSKDTLDALEKSSTEIVKVTHTILEQEG